MDEGIWGLIAIGAVLWGISAISFGEREGIVKSSDCRETVTLESDTLKKYYKTFTCSYQKTKGGKIMSGECIHIENPSSIFSSSNECSVAYVYYRKQDGICIDKKFPYLGRDDKCYTEYQF